MGERTACRVDRTGKGNVVICIVLPTIFETMNMSIPICFHPLLVWIHHPDHLWPFKHLPAIFSVYTGAGALPENPFHLLKDGIYAVMLSRCFEC